MLWAKSSRIAWGTVPVGSDSPVGNNVACRATLSDEATLLAGEQRYLSGGGNAVRREHVASWEQRWPSEIKN